jgi:hypothetical protein
MPETCRSQLLIGAEQGTDRLHIRLEAGGGGTAKLARVSDEIAADSAILAIWNLFVLTDIRA